MATLEEEYKKYTGDGYDQINSMYDAQKQSQLAGLESAYNQNLSNAQAARDALPEQYQARANDLSVQYERNRRNLNEQAAANGLNTGAGSQMQLALGSNYQRDYGGIRKAEQGAINEADRGIRDLQSAYQSSVQQAVADNDYARAQALLNEYKNKYSQQLQQAQTLASYGDFSAYLNVPGYTQAQVDAMRNTWIAENPQLAYNTGNISAEQYYAMTGKWPAGYSAPSAGNPYNPGYNPTPTPTPGTDNPEGADYERLFGGGDETVGAGVGSSVGFDLGGWFGVGQQANAQTIRKPTSGVYGANGQQAAGSGNGRRFINPTTGQVDYNLIANEIKTSNSRDAEAVLREFARSPYYEQASSAELARIEDAYNRAAGRKK